MRYHFSILILFFLFFWFKHFLPHSFISENKHHSFQQFVYASNHEKQYFKIRNREFIHPLPGEITSILVAATSDMHGTLGIFCDFDCDQVKGLLHLVPVIKELRVRDPQMLLLDGGDTYQGSMMQFYLNHVQPSVPFQDPLLQLMNKLRYDAMTLGNHDLEMPLDKLSWRMRKASFPFLGANIQWKTETLGEFSKSTNSITTPFQNLHPYHVHERNGVRLGILGMTTPGVPIWLDPLQIKDFRIKEILSSSRKWISVLRDEEKVDLLIGLFHSGADKDYDDRTAIKLGLPSPNASGQVAKVLKQFDLLIAGHTHQTIPKYALDELPRFSVPIIFPGAYAKGVSVVKIKLIENQQRWQIYDMKFDFKSARINQDPMSIKEEIGLSDEMLESVRNYRSQPSKVILKEIPEKVVRNDCLSKLSHVALQQPGKESKFSLLPGSWHTADIKREDLGKPILRKHLFQWMRYDNLPVLANLYGLQIRIMLNPMLRKFQERRIRSSTYLVPGGFEAVPVVEDGPVRLSLKEWNGSTIREDELYKVWMTNYHWNGGSDIRSRALLHDSQLLKREQRFLRDAVFDFLAAKHPKLPLSCKQFLEPI
jgi:2',3'-cyclic-nucleotide 2'-phosphodiesterase (5'-nucleotidase family)